LGPIGSPKLRGKSEGGRLGSNISDTTNVLSENFYGVTGPVAISAKRQAMLLTRGIQHPKLILPI